MPTEFKKDGHVLCPLCDEFVYLLTIQQAAKLTVLTTRSIRRYIDHGKIYNVRTPSRGYRVCGSCLLQDSFNPGKGVSLNEIAKKE